MILRSFAIALLGSAILLPLHSALAQSNLVIQGGTLIDGTGRAPIENSVIVIEGNRIKAVGRAGGVSIPAGAQVIDFRGKTVLPGFIDGHCHWKSFWGEMNPIPEFNSWQILSPTTEAEPAAIVQGAGPTTLRINGKGFWPFHQVLLNGQVLETKFVSRSQLQAIVPAALVRDVGMYKVTVKGAGDVVESSPAPLVVKFAP